MTRRELCGLTGLNRAALYRKPKPPSDDERRLRQAIVNAALDNPAYGTRRTTAEVKRQKLPVNRKRVQRVMRQEGLLRRPRRKTPQPTDSRNTERRYSNLTRDFRPDGLNQLWASDISYVWVQSRFAYVAVVLDVFSRKVVGWSAGANMKTALPLAALRDALSQRKPAPGWIHHSDQGSQYGSTAYVETLQKAGARISMSRKGTPQDNAYVESFFKTLKTEEVECNEYESLEQAQAEIGAWIERNYNRERLHSSLGYRSPEEFERQLEAAGAA